MRPATRRAARSFAGALPFAELCALIEAADLTITNNTGPMHVSAALKTPVVALFALTNPPEQWGPWRAAHRQLYHDVPCRLCYSRICPHDQECLRGVTPDLVVAAAAELLGIEGIADCGLRIAESRVRQGMRSPYPLVPTPQSAIRTPPLPGGRQ